jgi:hypothetical protein
MADQRNTNSDDYQKPGRQNRSGGKKKTVRERGEVVSREPYKRERFNRHRVEDLLGDDEFLDN